MASFSHQVSGGLLRVQFFVQVLDRVSGEFARVRSLARIRKMALNLGIGGAKNREAVVNIHRCSFNSCDA